MKLSEKLNKKINEALDDMIQCVIKIKDIGNAYKFIEVVEDNSDFVNQYDVDNEYSEGEQDPTIMYVLCYHKAGENIFCDENGEEYDIEGINESLNETKLNRDIFCDGQFVVEKRRFDCGINPQNKVSITQLPAYMLPNIVAIEDDEPGYFKFIKQASVRDGEYSTVKQIPLTTKYCETRQDVAKEIIRLLPKNESLNEGKLFYLGWRGNPQLKDGGYYKKLGQLTKKEAKDWEKCSYGSMTLKSFESEDEYNQAIEKAKEEGKSVR